MKEELKETSAISGPGVSRRRFLGYAGLAGMGVMIGSCRKDDDDDPDPVTPDGSVDLGSEDFGLLNYMYALKQLSAALYIRATSNYYTDAPTEETERLPEIRQHKIAHRELLHEMLGNKRIQKFDFFLDNKIDFTNRLAVLNAAREIEETTIYGFLGIAGRFASGQYLLQVAKMISVDGRHVAYLRNLVEVNGFAIGLDTNAADKAMSPEEVIAATSKYFPTYLSPKRLPKF